MQEFEPISESLMAKYLVENRGKLIYHAQSKYKVSKETAQDLYGEVAYKALHFRHKYNPEIGKITTFLFKVLQNTFIDTTRMGKEKFNNSFVSNEMRQTDEGGIAYTHEITFNQVEFASSFDHDLILKSLELLPERYGRLLKALAEDWSYEQIQAEYGIPMGTIKAQVNKARRVLANSLILSGVVDINGVGRSDYMVGEFEKTEGIIRQHVSDIQLAADALLGLKEFDQPGFERRRNLENQMYLYKTELRKLRTIQNKITVLENAA